MKRKLCRWPAVLAQCRRECDVIWDLGIAISFALLVAVVFYAVVVAEKKDGKK